LILINCKEGETAMPYVNDNGCKQYKCVMASEDNPHISDIKCDLETKCPRDQSCVFFPKYGFRCADPNPCSYFKCPGNTKCAVQESYPSKVVCSCVGGECPVAGTGTVSHHISGSGTWGEEHEVTIWEAEDAASGFVEAQGVIVGYKGEVSVREAKLYMRTKTGEKEISVLPETASINSKITQIEAIKLKVEGEEPYYGVTGKKLVKLFGFIPITMPVQAKVNAESGELFQESKAWWAFLASEE
jgi:hypothetical protein